MGGGDDLGDGLIGIEALLGGHCYCFYFVLLYVIVVVIWVA
jgi:hypothetical protein